MASLSLRALACTNPSRRSLISPTSCPRAMDCEKAWISWPATSFAITPASKRAARRPYSGSSPVNNAAVRIDNSSSSLVVAPSYKPEIVRVATRIGSTACNPSAARVTARTILLRSTASLAPLRLVTRMVVAVGGGVRSKMGEATRSASAASCVSWCMAAPCCGAPWPSLPRRSTWALEPGGWESGVATAATRADVPAADRAPPAISPRRFRGRHRAACIARLSAGLRARGLDAGALPTLHHLLVAASRGHRPSALSRLRFHLPLRGSAGIGPASLFIRWLVTRGTDGHKISWFESLSMVRLHSLHAKERGRLGALARHRPAPALRRAADPWRHRLVAPRAPIRRPAAPRVPHARPV